MSIFAWLGVIVLFFVIFCVAIIWMLFKGEENIDRFARGSSLYNKNAPAHASGSKLESQFMDESLSGELMHKRAPQRI